MRKMGRALILLVPTLNAHIQILNFDNFSRHFLASKKSWRSFLLTEFHNKKNSGIAGHTQEMKPHGRIEMTGIDLSREGIRRRANEWPL